MQSTYFGVAFSYQRGDDLPRLKLAASEGVIRYTLLSIINPSYLRRLQIHEVRYCSFQRVPCDVAFAAEIVSVPGTVAFSGPIPLTCCDC